MGNVVKHVDYEQQRKPFKGSRNRHNPKNALKKCTRVLVVKKANYINTVSCQLCVRENIYKVYKAKDRNSDLYQDPQQHTEEP
jgi:hypothetical protein